MQVDKKAVTATLRAQGEHDRAQRVECALPRRVDTERDAGLLQQLDLRVSDIVNVEAEAG